MKAATILSFAAAALAAPANKQCSQRSAAAAPQASAPSAAPSDFGGLVIRSGSPIHLSSINANGQAFWINKDTQTYCPDKVVECPPKDQKQYTVFSKGDGTLSLDVTVPGGQQVYVTSFGQLKFTAAHSASMDEGSVATGFSVTDGHLEFEGKSWYACPLGPQNGNAYGIYAVSKVTGENAGAQCLGFVWKTIEDTDPSMVWQYE